jgi:phage baseplate assembly protein gpV
MQKREVIALIAQFGASRRGVVTSYQPQPPMAKVQLMPAPETGDPIETGWIPVLSQWVGNGWGMVAPLSGGEQVYLGCEENDGGSYVVLGRYYSDEDQAPTSVAVGEIILQHQNGTTVHLGNTGTAMISAPVGVSLTAPDATHSGNFSVGSGVTCTFTSLDGHVITVSNGIVIGYS